MLNKALEAMEWVKTTPENGDLQVWWTSRRLGEEPEHKQYAVTTPAQAAVLIYALGQLEVNDENVDYNAGGLQEWDEEDREWYEWYDANGRDIREHFED